MIHKTITAASTCAVIDRGPGLRSRSPSGAADVSPGRQSGDGDRHKTPQAPEGRHNDDPSPLAGFDDKKSNYPLRSALITFVCPVLSNEWTFLTASNALHPGR